jgi:hypothetical protein
MFCFSARDSKPTSTPLSWQAGGRASCRCGCFCHVTGIGSLAWFAAARNLEFLHPPMGQIVRPPPFHPSCCLNSRRALGLACWVYGKLAPSACGGGMQILSVRSSYLGPSHNFNATPKRLSHCQISWSTSNLYPCNESIDCACLPSTPVNGDTFSLAILLKALRYCELSKPIINDEECSAPKPQQGPQIPLSSS